MAAPLGKTEKEIFKNYYKEKGNELRIRIENMNLESKNDATSSSISEESDLPQSNDFTRIGKYTKSLCYATYNSRAYAIALHKRSVVYFRNGSYENCANDIKLCLEADNPTVEVPRLHMEMASCYAKMRNLKNMLEAVHACIDFINDHQRDFSEDLKADYVKEIETFMNLNNFNLGGTETAKPLLEAAVIQEPHRLNPNVASSIQFKYINNSDTDYTAVRDILIGEVLLVENIYSHGIYTSDSNSAGFFYCDYCMEEAKNCIPCRTCVALVYCSEDCRLRAWNEYHQWECDIIRANFVSNGMILSLRTVIKAASSGVIKEVITKKSIKPGKSTEPYVNMYAVFVDLGKLRSSHNQQFLLCCQNAVLMVEFLKKSNFISYLISKALYNLSFDDLVDHIGGLLLKHNVQALKKSITVNRASPALASMDNFNQKIVLTCFRFQNFNAFCPMVSGIPHSCVPNTNIEFQGYTAVVKASKAINAGERIYRSTQNLSPADTLITRKGILTDLMITCNCEACRCVKSNCEMYDTFTCPACQGDAVFQDSASPVLLCYDCGVQSPVAVIALQLGEFSLARDSENLVVKLNCLENLKAVAKPRHKYIHEMYKGIMLLRSLKEDTNEFKNAMDDFQKCSAIRFVLGCPYHYLLDLIVICEAFFEFLHTNKANINEAEGMALLGTFSNLIKEAKNFAVVTFPAVLKSFDDLEVYLLKYRIDHIYLKM